MAQLTYNEIISEINKKIYHPVYLLAGEESYYIDKIAEKLENEVLNDTEKEFNLSILYGRDQNATNIIEYSKRYPMMSNYQLIIVREAQDLTSIDNLSSYIENPVPSTILVLCHKNKTPDKRKSFYKSVQKKGVYLESEKISLNKMFDWINHYIKSIGYTISNKAVMLLTEHVGNEISKISNEVSKLVINLEKGSEITETHIEDNIGISKDYNVFELIDAISVKNILKSNKIVFYFASHPKDHSIFALLPQLFDYFTKLMIYHETPKNLSPKELSAKIGINPYFLSKYSSGAKHYNREKIVKIIGYLKEYDLRAKGVDNSSIEEGELIKEMIFKILH